MIKVTEEGGVVDVPRLGNTLSSRCRASFTGGMKEVRSCTSTVRLGPSVLTTLGAKVLIKAGSFPSRGSFP